MYWGFQVYMRLRSGLFLFARINSFFWRNVYFTIIPFVKDLVKVNFFANLELIYDKILYDLYSLTYIFSWQPYFSTGFETPYMLDFYLQRFITYNFWLYNYYWLFSVNRLNKLRLRLFNLYYLQQPILKGFKFHFVGRFTRKQRAASIWFVEGYLPLNTVSSDIEFASYAIPLKNSLINVKVWFHRPSTIICD